MSKLLKTLIGTCLVMGSTLGHAATIATGVLAEVRPDSWSGGGLVLRISTTGTLTGTTSCTYPAGSNYFYHVPKDHVVYEQIFSVALSAQLADKTVKIVGDDSLPCSGLAPFQMEQVRMIQIE